MAWSTLTGIVARMWWVRSRARVGPRWVVLVGQHSLRTLVVGPVWFYASCPDRFEYGEHHRAARPLTGRQQRGQRPENGIDGGVVVVDMLRDRSGPWLQGFLATVWGLSRRVPAACAWDRQAVESINIRNLSPLAALAVAADSS